MHLVAILSSKQAMQNISLSFGMMNDFPFPPTYIFGITSNINQVNNLLWSRKLCNGNSFRATDALCTLSSWSRRGTRCHNHRTVSSCPDHHDCHYHGPLETPDLLIAAPAEDVAGRGREWLLQEARPALAALEAGLVPVEVTVAQVPALEAYH